MDGGFFELKLSALRPFSIFLFWNLDFSKFFEKKPKIWMKIWYIIRIHGEICSSYFKSGNEFPKSADFTKTSIFTNRKLVFLNNFFPKKYPWKEQKWKNERAKEFGTRFRFPAICWWRSRIKKFEKIHRLGKRKAISNSYKGNSAGDKNFLGSPF